MFNRKRKQKIVKAKDEREAKIIEIQALANVLRDDIDRWDYECELTRPVILEHMKRNLKTIYDNCESLYED